MFIGIAIGTFIGVLIGMNMKSINRMVKGLVKFALKGLFVVSAVYGVGSILLSVV